MIKKVYAIAQSKTITYGHGSFGTELHIEPVDGYSGKTDYHPIFNTRKQAEAYLRCNIRQFYNAEVIELDLL